MAWPDLECAKLVDDAAAFDDTLSPHKHLRGAARSARVCTASDRQQARTMSTRSIMNAAAESRTSVTCARAAQYM